MILFRNKRAFTLSEVLITLAIIGMVAALTLPNLIEKNNEKSWAVSAQQFQNRLTVAFKSMLANGELNSYSDTYEFINKGLKKYINITKVCTHENLKECFSENIINSEDNEKITLEDLSNSNKLGHNDWDTETVGIMFNNGITAIVAYNPNNEYYQDYIGEFSLENVFAAVYDVNGYQKPNTLLKDIRLMNAAFNTKPEEKKITCDDVLNNGWSVGCIELSNGMIFFMPETMREGTFNQCKSTCESFGVRMQTASDMQARCADGHGFPWWFWVDDGNADSQATAVYGSDCGQTRRFNSSRSDFSCDCYAN